MKQEQLAYLRSHFVASVELAAQVLDMSEAGVRAAIKRGAIPSAGVMRHEKVPTKFLLEKTGYAAEAEAA